MQSAQRVLIGGGAAYDCELGFVPDHIWGFTYDATPDSIVRFRYMGQLAEDDAVIAAGGGKYGWGIDGAVVSELTADTGFKPLEGSDTPRVMIANPATGKLEPQSVSDWLAATSYSSGERSATAVGTIVRPPTHNGYVYELTTDTGDGTSEPTDGWETTPGETCTDGGSNVWTCRKEILTAGKGEGITLGATLMTDGNTVIFFAEKFDDVEDLGDIG